MNSDLSRLLASTLIGGEGEDEACALAIDSFDNVYVTGMTLKTLSFDFPTTPGAYDRYHSGYFDVFISKFDGSLLAHAPNISVSPAPHHFGSINIGSTSAPQTFTIHNNGTADLEISGITIVGTYQDQFVKQNDNCSGQTLSPSETCIVQVVFSLTSAGSKSANLSIASDDPDSPNLDVPLSGRWYGINLLNPSDGERFNSCSLYDLPIFRWDISELFKNIEIEFSKDNLSTPYVKIKAKQGVNELKLTSSTWKKILLLHGATGGTVSWRVVGTKADKSKVESNIFQIDIFGLEPVGNPEFSPTSKHLLPTLTWDNNCNIKFKVWFYNDPDFYNDSTKPDVKKKSFSFRIKDPSINSAVFTKALTSGQWTAIKRLVEDVSGSTIYWHVESWDVLKGYSRTEPMILCSLINRPK